MIIQTWFDKRYLLQEPNKINTNRFHGIGKQSVDSGECLGAQQITGIGSISYLHLQASDITSGSLVAEMYINLATGVYYTQNHNIDRN